jgi:hypothetical protein
MERDCTVDRLPHYQISNVKMQPIRNPFTRRQGGITKTFPIKLYSMLQEIEEEASHSDIIRWNAKGNCFLIRKPQAFTKYLLPNYFRTNKFSSFQRQLNAYGFTRFNHYACGQDVYVYRHKIFHRDHAERLTLIRRKSSLVIQCPREERLLMNSKMYDRGTGNLDVVINDGSFQPSFHWSWKSLKSDFYEEKDLILDEVAAACLDDDGDILHMSGDTLMFWNPDLEKVLSHSDIGESCR